MITVLVVDDDFRVASVHAEALRRLPQVRVVGQATTLAQARARMAAGDVQLVVADEYLPDGSGTDLIGASDAGVLLVTAATSPDVVGRALLRGALGYLVKPFELATLAERVAEIARFVDAAARPCRDQAAVDALAASRVHRSAGLPPKGRSAVTASAVAALLRDSAGSSLTAIAVAEQIGISRATAQRYLSDLVDVGDATLTLRYGATGRPEHHYAWGSDPGAATRPRPRAGL